MDGTLTNPIMALANGRVGDGHLWCNYFVCDWFQVEQSGMQRRDMCQLIDCREIYQGDGVEEEICRSD